MKFLHFEVTAGPANTIAVSITRQCNVMLLDGPNFQRYRRGQGYRYLGGNYRQSPVILRPSTHGHYHLVVDSGGYPGRITAEVQVA
jgi:hypothetical protein